jgi:hypothetical protein
MPSKASKKTAPASSKRGKRTGGKRAKESPVWYDIAYPASAYTFPKEAVINQVCFDEKYLRVELTDGRNLEIPLWWIPTLNNAEPEEIAKYEITRDRRMIIWDPEKCALNDEISIIDYLGPSRKDLEPSE